MLYPLCYTTVQSLHPDDFQQHIYFCEWLLEQHEVLNSFIAHILWMDEACFTHDGGFQQSQQPYVVNPHAICPQRHQVCWSLRHCCVNVSAGILGNRMIGLYLICRNWSIKTQLLQKVTCVHTACTYVGTMLLQRVLSAIPRCTHACLDMLGGH